MDASWQLGEGGHYGLDNRFLASIVQISAWLGECKTCTCKPISTKLHVVDHHELQLWSNPSLAFVFLFCAWIVMLCVLCPYPTRLAELTDKRSVDVL